MTIEEVVRDYIRETVKPSTPDQARIKALQGNVDGQGWHCKQREISKGSVVNPSAWPSLTGSGSDYDIAKELKSSYYSDN